MLEKLSPLILAGPTTVGKSDLAVRIADMTDGVIINSDKYYLYAGRHFRVGLGLRRGELEDGRPRRLYGGLGPRSPLPTPQEYASWINPVIRGVQAMGRLAIVEGCTYSYNQELIAKYGGRYAIGLTWNTTHNLHERVVRRVETLLDDGLLEETQQALDNGLRDAFPMRKGILYRSSIAVLEGRLSLEDAKTTIAQEGVSIALHHQRLYYEAGNLEWLPYSPDSALDLADTILDRHIAAEKLPV